MYKGEGPPPNWRALPWPARFLLNLRKYGVVTNACEAAGTTRQNAYWLRSNSPEFREEWDIALDDAVDTLEHAAWSRARDGVAKLKFDARGNPIIDPRTNEPYVEYEYSDNLLALLLRANRREKYADAPRISINFLIQSLEQEAERLGIPLQGAIEGAHKALSGQSIIEGDLHRATDGR